MVSGPLTSDDLTRLLLAARDGDRVALSAWISQTQNQVLGLCRCLARLDIVEDVAQEIYPRADRALPELRGESSARTWLLVIAGVACAELRPCFPAVASPSVNGARTGPRAGPRRQRRDATYCSGSWNPTADSPSHSPR